jgi:hypothetical protein
MAMTGTDGRRAAVSPHDNRPGIGNHLSVRSERKTEPRIECVVWRPAGRVLRMQLMTNDALIARLSANLRPIRGTRARMSLLIAAAGGGAVAFALFWPSLGPRPDLRSAVLTTMFWVLIAAGKVGASLGPRVLGW